MKMERQTSFDPQSSEFLHEYGIGLLRETCTIEMNRIQEKDNSGFKIRAQDSSHSMAVTAARNPLSCALD